MINVGIAVSVIVMGFLLTYLSLIAYIKSIRNEKKSMKDIEVIIIGIFFGGPALLLGYIFPEIRIEDMDKHKRWLISGIILTILQVTLVTLLCVFKVIQ